ncbi:hypothetical protein [Luteolibacter sp. Populi]|uniref:hypothetical protein n=1 Tax=Luteolibacter sp. Populi TaxID=3230487 RepID=UPI003467DC82
MAKTTTPPKAPRETPDDILNEDLPENETDFDHGAEVTQASEREAVADDYEANARLDDNTADEVPMDDFSDEQDTADRPDTAAMFEEEGDEGDTAES